MGWSGVDLMAFPTDATLDDVSTEVGKRLLGLFQRGEHSPTVGQILGRITSSIGSPRLTGTPESVADQLQDYVEATDVDGFLVEYTYGGMATYRDVIDHVMPVLRRRGLLPPEPRGGSMRARITGGGDRLPATHPGAAYRGSLRAGGEPVAGR